MFDENEVTFTELILSLRKLRGKKYIIVAFSVLGYLFYLIYFNSTVGTRLEIEREAPDDQKHEVHAEISGAVANPGVYVLSEGSRVIDLIKRGAPIVNTASADWVSRSLNMSRAIQDSEKIYIPFEWELEKDQTAVVMVEQTNSKNEVMPPEKNTTQESYAEKTPDNSNLVNLNTAGQSELESLKGIGKVYAQRIIDNRPYTQIQDVVVKANIPESTMNNLKNFIAF